MQNAIVDDNQIKVFVYSKDEIETGLARLWDNPSQPFLLDVSLDIHTNVFPKMMLGNQITKMEKELTE